MRQSVTKFFAALVFVTAIYMQAPVAAQESDCWASWWYCVNTGGAPHFTDSFCSADGYRWQGFECSYWWLGGYTWGEYCGPIGECVPSCSQLPEGCPA